MSKFTDMHIRIAASLYDVDATTGQIITNAGQDGKKRSSSQRSADIMSGRYFVWNLLSGVSREFAAHRVVNDVQFDTNNLYDVSGLVATDMVDFRAITVRETTNRYTKPIPVISADEAPTYDMFLSSSVARDLAVVFGYGDSEHPYQLKLLKGHAFIGSNDDLRFEIGYHAVPSLVELTSSSTEDLIEPRVWHDVIEMYATYLGWIGSGNFKRGMVVRQLAMDHARILIGNRYGQSGLERVKQVIGE